MRTFVLALCLCLIPSLVFGGTKLTFHDGTTVCGNYKLQEDGKYCQYLSAGSVCWSKSDVAKIAQGECEEGGFAGGASGATDYQKKEMSDDARDTASYMARNAKVSACTARCSDAFDSNQSASAPGSQAAYQRCRAQCAN